MPRRITKTRYMRTRAISTPPPICQSKSRSAFFVSVCQCPECTDCVSQDFHDLTWPDAMAWIDAQGQTCGTWRYIDKELHIDESGSWNHCADTGCGITWRECGHPEHNGYQQWLGLSRAECGAKVYSFPNTEGEIVYGSGEGDDFDYPYEYCGDTPDPLPPT